MDYYNYAWFDDPIASSFILESGTALGLGQLTAAASAQLWYNTSSTLGCGNANASGSDAVLSCMRTKSYADILAAIPRSETQSIFSSGSFGPTIDEHVVFSDYLARSSAGNFTKRPMLIGNADYEGGLFRLLATFANVSYPDAFWDDFNNLYFNCPAAARANVSIANGIPTWRYRWFGVFPNTQLTSYPDLGAYHASELSVLFDTTPAGTNGAPVNTQAEVEIGSYMRGAWAAFAKDPVNGLRSGGYAWPEYEPAQETLVRLAFGNMTGDHLAMGEMYDAACNATFIVGGSAVGNGSSTGSGNGTASSSGSSSSTGSSPPATITASAGSRNAVRNTMFGALVAGLLCLL